MENDDVTTKIIKIDDFLEECILSITARIGGINLEKSHTEFDESFSCYSTEVSGSIAFKIVMCASAAFFKDVVDNMRHGKVNSYSDELYINEYFNILCGNIVSMICRETGHAARITVPVYQRNIKSFSSKEWALILTYNGEKDGETVKFCVSDNSISC